MKHIQVYTLLLMSVFVTSCEQNKKLSKELEMELLKAKLHLTSPIFNGLKIEPGLYEKFLKQIYDRG
jgi:hypothetical protein